MPRSLLALRLVLVAGAAAAAGRARAADPPLPPTVADLAGARNLALGGYRGLPTGNDGIFTNPASLAVHRRYAVETQYLQERVDGARAWQSFTGSVVDSETSAFASGFSYTRVVDGLASGNVYHLPVAGMLGAGLYAGVTGKLLDLRAQGASTKVWNVDGGLYWQASSLVGLGLVGYNLLASGESARAQAPQGMGAGLHVGDGRRLNAVVDWRSDFQRRGRKTQAWFFGGEYLLGDVAPVRAGFAKDDTRGGRWWSGGVGLVSTSGVAVDLSYRQGVDAPRDRTFAVALKLFLHSQ